MTTKTKKKYYRPDTEAVSALQTAVPQVPVRELHEAVRRLKERNRVLGGA